MIEGRTDDNTEGRTDGNHEGRTDDNPSSARVTLIGKPDCHLCDDARAIVATVCGELDVAWVERSILDDPALADAYWEQIPVVLVDGAQHDFWRVDAVRLRRALT